MDARAAIVDSPVLDDLMSMINKLKGLAGVGDDVDEGVGEAEAKAVEEDGLPEVCVYV